MKSTVPCLILLLLASASAYGQRLDDLATRSAIGEGETLVIGFLGGWERWMDSDRSVRRLVLRLRETPGVHAEVIENHHRRTAEKLVLRAFDRNRNGKLDAAEKSSARVVIFGQSMGGAACVKLAKKLDSWQVPVLLTAQIDSWGARDGWIPPNVKAAVNYYQQEVLTVRGQKLIRARDPQRTRILGNHQMHYPMLLPWPRPKGWQRQLFGGAHAKMEADPILWAQVEAHIRLAIAGSSLFEGR